LSILPTFYKQLFFVKKVQCFLRFSVATACICIFGLKEIVKIAARKMLVKLITYSIQKHRFAMWEMDCIS